MTKDAEDLDIMVAESASVDTILDTIIAAEELGWEVVGIMDFVQNEQGQMVYRQSLIREKGSHDKEN